MSAIDHKYTKEPVCPYCGCEEPFYATSEPTEEKCEECGETYLITPVYSVSYITEKSYEAEGGPQ